MKYLKNYNESFIDPSDPWDDVKDVIPEDVVGYISDILLDMKDEQLPYKISYYYNNAWRGDTIQNEFIDKVNSVMVSFGIDNAGRYIMPSELPKGYWSEVTKTLDRLLGYINSTELVYNIIRNGRTEISMDTKGSKKGDFYKIINKYPEEGRADRHFKNVTDLINNVVNTHSYIEFCFCLEDTTPNVLYGTVST